MRHILWQGPKNPTVQIQIFFLSSDFSRSYSLMAGLRPQLDSLPASSFSCSFVLQWQAELEGSDGALVQRRLRRTATLRRRKPVFSILKAIDLIFFAKFLQLALLRVSEFAFQRARVNLCATIFCMAPLPLHVEISGVHVCIRVSVLYRTFNICFFFFNTFSFAWGKFFCSEARHWTACFIVPL